ncbi:MAG: Mut7-C RNAse domain-containing protein [Anaerolineae bacterium]|nr:Mut7-C RNAse domain-containing protein [Anaerolineae bacterium]
MSGGGEPSFLLDGMLGRLARWLRLLGYDAAYEPSLPDAQLARRARAEGRILLTRDRVLARRRGVRAVLVREDRLEGQLAQLRRELGLSWQGRRPRCPACNEPLEPMPRDEAWGLVPPYVFVHHERFDLCPSCERVYWRGTHVEDVERRLQDLEAGARAGEGEGR